MVNPVPSGFHTVTPFILVKHAGQVVDFLQRAFGATEVYRLKHEDGSIWHAQVSIGDSMLMLGTCEINIRQCPRRFTFICPTRMRPIAVRLMRAALRSWSRRSASADVRR